MDLWQRFRCRPRPWVSQKIQLPEFAHCESEFFDGTAGGTPLVMRQILLSRDALFKPTVYKSELHSVTRRPQALEPSILHPPKY